MFDAHPDVDPSAPRHYRIRRSMTMEEFAAQVAQDLGHDPRRMRLWLMVNRQNKTIRPDQPIMDMRPTVEEVYNRSAAHRDSSLRVWVELAEDVSPEGEPIWPSYQSQPNGVVVKNDVILLLLKHFDSEKQTLQGVGHLYIGKEKKVEEMVPLILKAMNLGDKLPGEEKLLLWEVRIRSAFRSTKFSNFFQEIKPTMIEPLKAKQTLKVAELQDGDIVCFQRSSDRKPDPARIADKPQQEP